MDGENRYFGDIAFGFAGSFHGRVKVHSVGLAAALREGFGKIYLLAKGERMVADPGRMAGAILRSKHY